MKFQTSSLVISLAFVVASFASIAVNQADGSSVGYFIDGAKNYLVSLVKDGIISRSNLVSSFGSTMEAIKLRYKEAKERGELDGKDDAESSAFYYKIVIDEIRKLKEKIAAETGSKVADDDETDSSSTSIQDRFMNSCVNCAKKVNKPRHYDMMMDMDMDMDDEDDEELDLMNELDSLEAQRGPEMGWGMSAESRAALQSRTLQVLGDLVQNELKTLAMIIVTGYIGGPAVGAMGPAVAAANVSIRFKLIEFFMHSVMDMFAALLGQKISPQMENPLVASAAVQNQAASPSAGAPVTPAAEVK